MPSLPNLIQNGEILMRDNARTHTAKVCKEWLANQGWEVMEWPPYSPDLNPIEMVL